MVEMNNISQRNLRLNSANMYSHFTTSTVWYLEWYEQQKPSRTVKWLMALSTNTVHFYNPVTCCKTTQIQFSFTENNTVI